MVLLQFEEELLILNKGDTDPPNYPVQDRIRYLVGCLIRPDTGYLVR
jgi:hypothetical protein